MHPIILVTGFGAFPGARRNPTEHLMQLLAQQERRFARLGVKLERRVLPVVYDEIAPRLDHLIAEIKPDAVLHFGLAARRNVISIEMRALNRMTTLHPDAAGRFVTNRHVWPGETAFVQRARVPASRLDAALRRAGIGSKPSIDAGDYVCNQTYYRSLAMARGTERRVGFVHVPKLSARALAKAAILLIMALLPELRRPVF